MIVDIKKRIYSICLIVLILITVTSSAVFGATISFGGYPPNMYNWDNNLFSAIHGARLGAWDAFRKSKYSNSL